MTTKYVASELHEFAAALHAATAHHHLAAAHDDEHDETSQAKGHADTAQCHVKRTHEHSGNVR